MKKTLLLKIFCFGLALVFSSGSLFAQLINTNGGFEESAVGDVTGSDVTSWSLAAEGGSAVVYSIVDDEFYEGSKSLRIWVSGLGANPWDVQVVNEPFIVVPGTEYTYSIWAKADITGPIVSFTVGDPSYSEMLRLHQQVITTEWQEFTRDFTVPAGKSDARAPIHFGESANSAFLPFTIYIDNLQIKSKTVGVKEEFIPTEFSLEQNFPNPFNPETTIKFSLPASGNVNLVLYDLLGNAVKEIAKGNFSAGQHQVKLNASNLASGVYFYKLESGNFISAKKLILMK